MDNNNGKAMGSTALFTSTGNGETTNGRSEAYAAGGAREGRAISTASPGMATAAAISVYTTICGAASAGIIAGSLPTPVAQIAHADGMLSCCRG